MNNTSIISIIVFIMIIAAVIMLMRKAGNIKIYNIFIYISLLVFWIPTEIFMHQKMPAMKPWMLPILISIFQLTQVLTRIPFGILSAKLNSRKKIMQIAAVIFIVCASTTIITNFSIWSIFLTMFGAGITGFTFGLNNQYWSENWNIKRVFFSTAIIFTIPQLSGAIGSIFKSATTAHGASLGEVPWFRWLFMSSIILMTIYLGLYTFIKEKKETIKLDDMAPSHIALESKGIKRIIRLSISVAAVAFVNSMITYREFTKYFFIGFDNELGNMLTIIPLIMIGITVFVAVYLVKHVDLHILKLGSLAFVAIGVIASLIMSITKTGNWQMWLIMSFIITMGSTMFQVILFGSALHLDHKHPTLALGIFLTIRSAANVSGQLISGELLENKGWYLGNRDLPIIVISLIALFVIVTSFAYMMCIKKDLNKLECSVVKYEFD